MRPLVELRAAHEHLSTDPVARERMHGGCEIAAQRPHAEPRVLGQLRGRQVGVVGADGCRSSRSRFALVSPMTAIVRDLDHLDETTITVDEKHYVIGSEIKGPLGRVFQAAGVAIPPALRPA